MEDTQVDGMMFGIAMRNRNRADQAEANQRALQQSLDSTHRTIALQAKTIENLENHVFILRAGKAGLKAQIEALTQEQPNTPLLAATGKRFRDGDTKSRIRLIYEAAADAFARAKGITDPTKYRRD
jgi:hypothetical protein